VGVALASQRAVYKYVIGYNGRLHYIEIEVVGQSCYIKVYRDEAWIKYSLGEDGEELRVEVPLADYPAGVARFPVTGYVEDGNEIELFLDELQTLFDEGEVLCKGESDRM